MRISFDVIVLIAMFFEFAHAECVEHDPYELSEWKDFGQWVSTLPFFSYLF